MGNRVPSLLSPAAALGAIHRAALPEVSQVPTEISSDGWGCGGLGEVAGESVVLFSFQ